MQVGKLFSMGLSRVCVLGILWSCYVAGLVLSADMILDQLSGVRCGPRDLTFSLPVGLEAFAADIAVLDNKDNARSLQNDTACGLWIGRDMEKTLLVTAAYDGCYVREEDEDYVMTVIIDRIDHGELDHQKKDLKCPLKQAMDTPSASDCAVIQKSDRLPCAENAVSRDVCEGLGCCFSPSDSSPCYFGKEVTAQCTVDGQVLVAISKDVTIPSLILDSAHVVNVDSTSCPGLNVLKNSAFVAFRFPLSCGVRKLSGNEMVYENTFEATIETMIWQGASITRDSTMRLMVRCNYSQTAPAPLMVEVVTLPPPPPVSTTGPLFLEMRLAQDAQYRSYYQDEDYPLIKGLRDLVYLEVRILRRTDPNLVLVLNDCWATPSSDPTQEMQWFLLVGSCPYTGEEGDYLTVVSPVGTTVDLPKHYKRFIVSAFVFVDEPTQTAFSEEVYFHCSASVCIPSARDPCSPSCGQRQKRAVKEPLEQIIVSKGPINIVAIESRPNVKMNVPIEGPMNHYDLWNLKMLNETDAGFIGAQEGPIDGNLIEAEKLVPRRTKGATDEKPNFMMWVRGAAIGGGIFMVLVTILGIWRCHRSQRPTMHTVKI